MPENVKLFLSAVSSEFEPHRRLLAGDLKRPNLEVKEQQEVENTVSGQTTLEKLDTYIRQCDGVIHLIGKATGAVPEEPAVAALLTKYPDMPARLKPLAIQLSKPQPGFSYTQWEAYFALFHHKPLFIYLASDLEDQTPTISRCESFTYSPEEELLQKDHHARISAMGHDRGKFTTEERLSTTVLKDLVEVLQMLQPTHKGTTIQLTATGFIKPPPHNHFFVGRNDLLVRLHSAFTSADSINWRQTLAGLDGIGKKSLAAEYIHHYSEDTWTAFWVCASTPADIESGFAAISRNNDLPVRNPQNDDEHVKAAQHVFANRRDILIVLYDVDHRLDTASIFPFGMGGRVLLTTAHADLVPAEFPPAIEVFGLDRSDAVDYLFAKSGRSRTNEDAAEALALATFLHGNPSQLEQAAARLQREPQTTLQQLALEQPRNNLTTARKYRSISALLNVCASMAPAELPDKIVETYLRNSPTNWRQALQLLHDYALANWDPERHTFTVPRHVQSWIRDDLPTATRQAYALKAAELLESVFPAPNADSWDACEPLLPHALVCAENVAQYAVKGAKVGRLLYRSCLYLKQRSRLETADTMQEMLCAKASDLVIGARDLEELERVAARSLAGNDPDLARQLNNYAQELFEQARYGEAEPLMARVVSIFEKAYGENHPNVATALNNLAQLLQATNRLSEAEPLMRRALAINERNYAPDHPDVATCLNNLAQLLQATNRLSEAEPLMRRALTIDEKSFGPNHPNVAIRLNNLARLLQATNRLSEAEPLMRRALTIDEASYGPDHPDVARDLNNLAQLLQATNRIFEAEPLMARVVSILEKVYGQDHPDVAISLNNLAGLFHVTNRLSEAEPLMRRHLEIFMKFTRATGHQHPHLMTAGNNYRILLMEMGRLQEEATEALKEIAPELF